MYRETYNPIIEITLLTIILVTFVVGCSHIKYALTPPDNTITQEYETCLNGDYVPIERGCGR